MRQRIIFVRNGEIQEVLLNSGKRGSWYMVQIMEQSISKSVRTSKEGGMQAKQDRRHRIERKEFRNAAKRERGVKVSSKKGYWCGAIRRNFSKEANYSSISSETSLPSWSWRTRC